MTLNEASEKFQISIEKLKSYEENGLLNSQTLSDGTLDYKETEIRRAGMIHFLLRSDMDIDIIKKYLRLLDDENQSSESKEEQIRILRKQRCRLLDAIHDKQQALDELDYMIAKTKKINCKQSESLK